MKYNKTITLNNGRQLLMHHGTAPYAREILENFIATHSETDYLLTYPEENTTTVAEEADFLRSQEASPNAIEIVAWVDGKVAGTAGISPFANKYKVRHRADFGISLLREYWGMGIGRHLTQACIDCAQKAGYQQVELEVVADNTRAITLYEHLGFREFGRNPKAFLSKEAGFQEVILMRLEL